MAVKPPATPVPVAPSSKPVSNNDFVVPLAGFWYFEANCWNDTSGARPVVSVVGRESDYTWRIPVAQVGYYDSQASSYSSTNLITAASNPPTVNLATVGFARWCEVGEVVSCTSGFNRGPDYWGPVPFVPVGFQFQAGTSL